MIAGPLIDSHHRRIRKLRVSLLDTCNFRCLYCMPEHPRFMPARERMSVNELMPIVQTLCDLGIEEIRLTGGEPTLRHDLVRIAERMSALPLTKIALTSNGFHLRSHLAGLRKTRLEHINISLDSLQRDTFGILARTDGLHRTLDSIRTARDMGFRVKINTVVLRNINHAEIPAFVEFARREGVEVRFLEVMAIGTARSLQGDHLVPADEILAIASREAEFSKIQTDLDSTAECFQAPNGARIGVIAPVTRSFCRNCSRWRLSAKGELQTCLMNTDTLRLRGLNPEAIRRCCIAALPTKPWAGRQHTENLMHALGG